MYSRSSLNQVSDNPSHHQFIRQRIKYQSKSAASYQLPVRFWPAKFCLLQALKYPCGLSLNHPGCKWQRICQRNQGSCRTLYGLSLLFLTLPPLQCSPLRHSSALPLSRAIDDKPWPECRWVISVSVSKFIASASNTDASQAAFTFT